MDRTLGSHLNHYSPPQQQTSSTRGKCTPTASPRVPFPGRRCPCGDHLAAMQPCPTPVSRHRRGKQLVQWGLVNLAILTLLLFIRTSSAVYIDFENCLSPSIIHSASDARGLLQFTPYHVWASFNDSAPSHTLNVTVYGNISGIATDEDRPLWNDPQWLNPNQTKGKIVEEDEENDHLSTFFARFNVLDYTPYAKAPSSFCENTIHQQCPLIPAFNLTGNKYVNLPTVFARAGS